MPRYKNILLFFQIAGMLLVISSSNTIREKRIFRSPQLSNILQTPEELPVVRSNTNTFKLNRNDFTKNPTLSRLGSSDLHGFQYEVYFPPNNKYSQKSEDKNKRTFTGDNIKTSETSEFKSVLPPYDVSLRNMEIRPFDKGDYQDVEQNKESDEPEFVGYFYDPPPTTTESTTCHHIEHDTEEGYIYEPPAKTDPELDRVPSIEDSVKDNNLESVESGVKSFPQTNENYFPSASNQQEVFQKDNTRVDPEFPNYSSVKFRSSFFGENGLPRVIPEEEVNKIPPEYNFAYVIRGETELGHEESLVDDTARGSYHVLLPDGRLQHIQYEADSAGYRPVIRYKQP